MKIGIISTPVFRVPVLGYSGLEHLAYQQAEGLAKRGHEIYLFAPDGSTCPGVTVVPIGPEGRVDEKTAFSKYWQELLKLDIICDNSWNKWSYTIKAEGVLKCPVLGWMHAPVNTMFESPPPVEKPCMVCISNDQRQHYEALFGRPARTCYNGIDLDFYKPLGIPRSGRFLFLARFSSVKSPDLAIEACKRAGVELDLVGDTKLTGEPEYLRSILGRADGKQIRFVGPATRSECVYWFSQARALIHPTRYFREPFGLAPVEAMACFPADTPVRAHGIQRTFSLSYTGILLQLATNYGRVECTPEHPFMTQRGWVAAKDLTLADSLVKVHHEWSRVDEEGIGDIVRVLSSQGNEVRSEVVESIPKFGEIQGEEAWATATGSASLYREGRKNHSRCLSRKGISRSSEDVAQDKAGYPQEGSVSRSEVQVRLAGLYTQGRGVYPEFLSKPRPCFCSEEPSENHRECESEGSGTGSGQAYRAPYKIPPGQSESGRASVSSRADRWRRHNQSEEGISEEKPGSSHPNFQYVTADCRVDFQETELSQCGHSPASGRSGEGICQGEKSLFLDHRLSGVQIPSYLSSSSEVPSCQATTDRIDYRVVGDSLGADENSRSFREGYISSKDVAVYEFARLRSISGREVCNLPVFNLGTCSGDYEAAGYLVHNCGCPVVAWRYGALPETVKDKDVGFLVDTMDELVERIQYLNRPDTPFTHDFAHRCREHAKKFSLENMVSRCEELCHEALAGGW